MPFHRLCQVRLIRTERQGLRPFLLIGGTPVILANLWAEDLLHSFSQNTVESYLRDVAIAYEWSLERGSPLESKIERFAVFSPNEIRSLADRLCQTAQDQSAGQSTCMRRLEAMKSFIDYSFDHYIELHRLSLSEQTQAEKNKTKIINRLRKKIIHNANQSAPSQPSTALTEFELQRIIQAVAPESPDNPFLTAEIRFRNYCLIRVMLETLARRGEVVLIELTDLELGHCPTITIKWPTKNNQQKRKDGACLKTRGRTVPISTDLAEALEHYISSYRDDLLVPKRPCTALFVSSRDGKRLSARTVNSILRTLSIVPNLKSMTTRVHPHGIRTTAANTARKLLENSPATNIDIADSLAYLGGWAPGSSMVQHYTKLSISDRLGKLLRQPQSDSAKRGESNGKPSSDSSDPRD